MADGKIDTSRMEEMNRELISLLRGEESPLMGDEGGRQEELLNVHHKYTNMIRSDYQGIRSSKSPTDSTYDFIVSTLIGHRPSGNNQPGTKGNDTQEKLARNMKLEKLFTMGETYVITV